jgi:hypothetical protein
MTQTQVVVNIDDVILQKLGYKPFPAVPVQFNQALDRIRVKIYPNQGEPVLRDIRNEPFSNGLEYMGQAPQGWKVLFIRCDDMVDPTMINGKAQIIFGLYWSPTNVDAMAPNDPWGDVPIMGIDTGCFGAWKKDIIIDGIVKSTYDPNLGNGARSFWLEGLATSTEDDFSHVLRTWS